MKKINKIVWFIQLIDSTFVIKYKTCTKQALP